MKIVISLSKSKEIILEIKNDATVNELKIEFAKKCKKNIHRQSFKKVFGDKITRLEDSSKSLQSYGITDGDKLIFKDLMRIKIQEKLLFGLNVFALVHASL